MSDDVEATPDDTDEANLSIRREVLNLGPDADIHQIETTTLRARNARYGLAPNADESDLERAILAEVLDALGLDDQDTSDDVDRARETRREAA